MGTTKYSVESPPLKKKKGRSCNNSDRAAARGEARIIY